MTLNELYREAKAEGRDQLCRFMRDMRRAGLRMRYYQGRFYWKGPAVVVESLQDALSATKVKCQWDGMGLGHVVYPQQGL